MGDAREVGVGGGGGKDGHFTGGKEMGGEDVGFVEYM